VILALAAIALAVPALVFVAWPILRGRSATTATPPDETRESLEGEKLIALRAIREIELERETGLLAEEDYADLRARYEAHASAVLRQLDALPAPVAPAPKRRPPAAAPSAAAAAAARGAAVPWTQRPLVLTGGAVGILVFGVLLGVLVVRYTGPAPPDPMAGPPPVASVPGVGAVPLPESPGAGAEAGSPRPIPPAVLDGMLKAAHQSLDAGRYQEAIAAYKAVLKRQPENVDAITHLGIILGIAGHADGALEAFDRALAIQPDYAHALWDKARVLSEQRQDYAGAIATWERFIAVSGPGEDRERAQALIREARAKAAAGSSGGAPVGPAGAKP
jgi:tetratricopeptide (TPR) repeat protein